MSKWWIGNDDTDPLDEPWVTIDVGYVHVLTEPGGPCEDTCPHPDHSTPMKEST